MRDPNRIDKMIDNLHKYWKKHPDMRLGQIVANVVGVILCNKKGYYKSDPFYLEDDLFVEGLEMLDKGIDDALDPYD